VKLESEWEKDKRQMCSHKANYDTDPYNLNLLIRDVIRNIIIIIIIIIIIHLKCSFTYSYVYSLALRPILK
jgi:hypothetical protein